MAIEKNLSKIKRLAGGRSDENWEFRSFLKGLPRHALDKLAYKLYYEISSAIECTECGNCCKEVKPVLTHSDIERFVKAISVPTEEFKSRYLTEGKQKGEFEFSTKSCPFLQDKRCSQYSARPEVCRSFPHLHKKAFASRAINVIANYAICPIVFNVYEGLKKELCYGKESRCR